ncbi:MMPL family transporter [Corynebacterium sputi]|uniref:MMPL family transporter n=1 Tax=Corynebacterium sputi TaxID=489915 RepID=UPI000400CFD7|nr:MMPL family transporter [Corynebacterium sputi]
MAKLLYRLGRSAYLNRLKFLAAWLLVVIGMGVAAFTLSEQTATNFTIPGLESVDAQEQIQERFDSSEDELNAATGSIVIQAPEGSTLADPDVAADVESFLEELRGIDGLADQDTLVNPVMAAAGMEQQLTEAKTAEGMPPEQIASDIAALSPLSEDGRTGLINVEFDAPSFMDINEADKDAVIDAVEANQDDLTIAYSGNAFQTTDFMGAAELIGIAVAALILIITFGSLVASGMPLITGVVGVGIGVAGVYAATAFTDSVNDTTPMLASMIGLAVGIDYSLFIVSRFRNEVVAFVKGEELTPRELGPKFKDIPFSDRAHLAGLAVGKAGTAVVFAGMTVVIALAALSIIGIPFLTAMAVAAAATVIIAVLVALTLLPALLSLFGSAVFSGKLPFIKAPDPECEAPTMGLRWVRQVRKRPGLFAGAGVILLAVLAIPAAQLHLAMPSDGTMSPDSPNRVAYDITEDAFGPGRNAPMVALIDTQGLSPEDNAMALGTAVQEIQSVDGVVNAQVIAVNEAGDAAQLLVTPEYGATDERAGDVLHDIRDQGATFQPDTGATFSITGVTPIYEDISERLSDVLIPYVAIVVVLAFLLLMLVFRSIWVPLIAALGFALSVAATFGLTVALWQEGWGGIVSDPQPIISFLPIILIGLVFGLAMDYQVFLVSRMREGWAHGKTAANAVSNGFKHGARVVTAAALIMISVFAAFMLMDEQFIKSMGFALAAAVLFDAFIVRMTIVPAVMFMLGEKTWYLPKWLDKILPHVDVEGTTLADISPGGENEDKALANAAAQSEVD